MPPRPALLLGAAVWSGGTPSPALRRRTLHAARLWREGRVTHVICCGGKGRVLPAEAEVMRALLLAEGLPPEAILLEDRSTTTHENLLLALPLLATLGAREVVVVTDLTHAPRARLIARGLGLRATTSSPPLRGAHPRTLLRQALRELPATLLALWRLARLRR